MTIEQVCNSQSPFPLFPTRCEKKVIMLQKLTGEFRNVRLLSEERERHDTTDMHVWAVHMHVEL
jgi:hypothetical protein